MQTGVFLHGLELKNYRGIGPEPQLMAPFGEFNIFVGANNAGKSTVLDFIHSHLSAATKGKLDADLTEEDKFRGKDSGPTEVLFGFPVAQCQEELDSLRQSLAEVSVGYQRKDLRPDFNEWLSAVTPLGLFWVRRQADGPHNVKATLEKAESHAEEIPQDGWFYIWQSLHPGKSGGSYAVHWLPKSLEKIAAWFPPSYPKAHLIPAKRQIGTKDDPLEGWGGRGIIALLAEHQNPAHTEQEKKRVFDKINTFLREVTGKRDAQIEIPHDRAHILVHMDGKTLPLDRLGTGIHEVILIAAACTLTRGEIMCIEEPENHLHPILQRKLIQYLSDNTDNQYFIATHSAAFIDMEGAQIFHVENDGHQARIKNVTLKADRRRICDDLGYRASDIVQANAVIWVEGPSDRIYLKHWLKAVDERLVEGIHYAIIFYGGRLLSHLSANDEDASDLIDLLALNRFAAIMIDSDRERKGQHLNTTKKRVENELEKSGGFVWITQGREVENYVPADILDRVLKDMGHTMKPLKSKRQYARLHELEGSRKGARKYVDKVKIARAVANKEPDLSELDLEEKLKALAKFIQAANGLNAQ